MTEEEKGEIIFALNWPTFFLGLAIGFLLGLLFVAILIYLAVMLNY